MTRGKIILLAALAIGCLLANLSTLRDGLSVGYVEAEMLEREPAPGESRSDDRDDESRSRTNDREEPGDAETDRRVDPEGDTGGSRETPRRSPTASTGDAQEFAAVVERLRERLESPRELLFAGQGDATIGSPFDPTTEPANPAEESMPPVALRGWPPELDHLRSLPLNAILVSPSGGMVRLAGYSLRPGMTIPGYRATLHRVLPDRIEIALDGEIFTLFMSRADVRSSGGSPSTDEPTESDSRP